MLLLVLLLTHLLGALVHGQGAIPLHDQVLKLFGERLTLQAFLARQSPVVQKPQTGRCNAQ